MDTVFVQPSWYGVRLPVLSHAAESFYCRLGRHRLGASMVPRDPSKTPGATAVLA